MDGPDTFSARVAGLPPLWTGVTTGLVIGVLQVFLAVAYAALIFSGDLAEHLPRGIGLALLGTTLTGLVIAAFASLPGTIGGSQNVPVAIMAVMASTIATGLPGGGSSLEGFSTVIVAIALATLATGVFFWGLGRFQLGGLVRFLPYPVIGGFLAGTGWLFVTGALGMMSGIPLTLGNLSQLFQSQTLLHWLPGLFLAVIMLLASRRSDHLLVLPALLLGATLTVFVVARFAGATPAELSAAGWLLGPVPSGEPLWRPVNLDLLSHVNWSVLAGQIGNVVAITLVSAVSLLLNAGGLELATDHDVEVNHDLQITGGANVLAGLAGGLVGYKQLGLSKLNLAAGGRQRFPGLLAAGLVFLALVAGAPLAALFPKMIAGALLLFLGLDLLFEWIVQGWQKLPGIDFAIVLVILFVTVFVGFLEAVALGLLLALVLFVVSYSRIDVVRHELNGESYQSRVSRSRQQDQFLKQHGDRLYVLKLQGFIFFGTANNLLNQLRARISDPDRTKPDFIVLDFQRVTGLDSTGMLSFTRMKQLAENAGITLVLTQLNERVLYQLRQGGLEDDGRVVRIYHSLDQGVEACENQLLTEADVETESDLPSLVQQLLEILLAAGTTVYDSVQVQELLDSMQRLNVEAGQVLIAMGDSPNDLLFVESGQVTAQLPREGQPPLRLQTSGGGSVIGEIGFYLGQKRSADVIAESTGLLYRLTLDDLQKLEESTPEAASVLHQIIIQLLAERVIHLTNTVKALERK